MSIKQVDSIPKVEGRGPRHKSRIKNDIIDFMNSDMVLCELSTEGHKSADNVRSCAWMAIRNIGCNVKVFKRGEKIYLLKTGEV